MKTLRLCELLGIALSFLFLTVIAAGQDNPQMPQQNVRTVTIPISIFTKKELEQNQAAEYVQADRLLVKEDKDDQTILSIKSVSD
ncbi:MAG: hypothetical protein ACRD43_01445, partial [Pyrinomonadaceae bacterium]